MCSVIPGAANLLTVEMIRAGLRILAGLPHGEAEIAFEHLGVIQVNLWGLRPVLATLVGGVQDPSLQPGQLRQVHTVKNIVS
jgi:hypothetical protein